MNDAGAAWVFDTGPLRHFADSGWLGVLKFLTNDRPVLIPESVEAELQFQVNDAPALHAVLDAGWITVDRSNDLSFLSAFASYSDRLAVGRTNLGECGVLALGKVRGFEVVIDDGTARQIADDESIAATATLPLLCTAIREKQLTVPLVENLADDLLEGEYFLPFQRGGFRQWAIEEGLLDYE